MKIGNVFLMFWAVVLVGYVYLCNSNSRLAQWVETQYLKWYIGK